MKETKGTVLKKLFFSTLYISAFTFGGGFVIITFMKRKFVDELHWIDMTEMLDLTALAQSSPGAIAVNAAILVGWRVAGLMGMLIAVLGTILPPMLILSVISLCRIDLKGNAGGGSCSNSGCRMWSWKQCDQTEKTDISGDHGSGFFGKCGLEGECDLYYSGIGPDGDSVRIDGKKTR